MAVIDTLHPRPEAGSIARVLTKLTSAFSAWSAARATRASLSRLSDRELDDIGLSRGDVDRIGTYR